MDITVLGTDGSPTALFNFFCDGKAGGAENFVTDTACNVTLQLPTALAVTAAVSATPSSVATGATSTLTFTLTNPNTGTGLGALSGVADNVTLPSGVAVASTPNASTTCGGTFSPTPNATALSLSGGTLAAGSSCTFRVDVTPSTAGTKTVPTGVPTATGATAGVAGTSATLTVNQPSAPTASVSTNPTTILVGGTSTLTFTLANPNGTIALSGVADSVTLPAGLAVAVTPNASTNCAGATFAPAANATSLSLSGGSLAASASCTYAVDVTASTTGTKTIPTGAPSATGATAGVAGTSATLTVNQPSAPTASVSTNPTTILVGGTSTLTFTLANPNGTIALSGVADSVTLPAGLAVAVTPNASTNCAGATFAPAANATSLSLSGGSLAASASCTYAVDVTASTTGTKTIPTGAPSATGATAGVAGTSANLNVNGPLTTTVAVATTTLTVGSAATPFTPVTATGGTGTLSYALSGGTLPTGLSFSLSTGQITGTPSTPLASTNFTVTVTDQSTPTAQTSSKNFSLTVNPALATAVAVPSTTLTTGIAATPFAPVTATGGTGTLSYVLSGGTLPTGLSFSASTGQITGTPTTTLTTTTFTVTVTDQTTPTPQTSFQTFSLTVNPTPITTTVVVASTTLTVGSAATSFTPVTASGGTGTLSYALSGGVLPLGLTFSTSNGQISGTPTSALTTTTFTVTVTDQTTPTPQTSSKTFNLTVNPALTTTPAVPNTVLTVGIAATPFAPVTATGGTGTLSYALSGGTLPTGLTFSTSTGQISGTPSTALAPTSFTVTVTDQTTPTPQSASQFFLLTVNQPLTTTVVVPSAALILGSPVAAFQPVSASGGAGILTYTLSGGTLPTGLNFTSNGLITGTPSTTLTATTFTVTVTDQSTPTPQTSSKTFDLAVNPALTTTQAVPSTALITGVAASFTPVTASGGTGTLSYALSVGILPTGLTFSTSNGLISGTPSTTLVPTNFTVTVTDQATPTHQSSSQNFLLSVNQPLTTTVVVPSVALTVGSAVAATQPVSASGGAGILTYTLSGGTLPTGLNFTSNGLITGTPSTTLTATTFTVTVTDQSTPTPQTSSKTFDLAVNPALTTTQAVPSTALITGVAASFTPVTASGGTGTLSYALSGGILPTGLTFSTSNGLISGTPSTTLVTTNFTVTVTDQTTPAHQSSSQNFLLSANGPLTTTVVVPSVALTVGSAVAATQPVSASGGAGILTYTLSGGTLPAGLNFTSNGLITGTPSTTLTLTTFTVTVTDQTTPTPQTSSKTFNLTVNPALTTALAVPNTTLTTGVAASFTPVTASGGTGTLHYALSGGILPIGLNFSTTTGLISGTPTSALATTTFTVTVTDQTTPGFQTSSQTFNLTVNVTSLTTTQAIPSTILATGTAASFTPVTAAGGTGTLIYALSGGILPTGLTFSPATGRISGTATSLLAATTFTVTVTDQTTPTAQTSFKTFSLTVNVTPLTTTPAVPSTALTQGSAATPFIPVTASGGTGTLTFALSGSTLPAGLSFSATTGQISGTPSVTLATTTFTVTVTDQTTPTAQTSFKTFNLTVASPVIAVSSTATVIAGVSTTVDLTNGATGGPFTAATLLSLTPPNAGTALITLGDTASNSEMVVAALVTGGRFLLKFTPAPTFTGSAVATFTLSNAFATSAPATVTFVVLPRPDPSKDPEVVGVINAQTQAAQHLASTQITNFNDRLESLHDLDCHRNSFHLGLTDSRSVTLDTDPLRRTSAGSTSAYNALSNFGSNKPWYGAGLGNAGADDGTGRASRRGAAAKKRKVADNKPDDCGDEATRHFAAWTGGYVNFGKLSTGTSTSIDYLNAGVSAGVDYRFSPTLTVGLGFGYGNDKSTIGSNGTISNAFSYDVVLYGSWHPARHTFVDALIGYGIMSFDSNRFITGSSGDFAAGSRSGHQVFGSLTSGYEYKASGFLISPYGRLSASWSALDAFTETGGGVFALQYGTQSVTSLTGGFGLRTSYEFKEPWGALTPRLRIEYAHEFAGGSTASIAYADQLGLGGTVYTLPIGPTGSDYVTTGVGTDIAFAGSWLLGIDYRTSFGQEKTPPQMVQVKLGTKF